MHPFEYLWEIFYWYVRQCSPTTSLTATEGYWRTKCVCSTCNFCFSWLFPWLFLNCCIKGHTSSIKVLLLYFFLLLNQIRHYIQYVELNCVLFGYALIGHGGYCTTAGLKVEVQWNNNLPYQNYFKQSTGSGK